MHNGIGLDLMQITWHKDHHREFVILCDFAVHVLSGADEY